MSMENAGESVKDPVIRCYTDGASRGNPGPSAYAFILVRGGTIIARESGFIGTGTNNVAEYEAVIRALDLAAEYGTGSVEVFSDSELVVRQLNGLYAVKKPHLGKLFEEVQKRISRFRSVKFVSVSREDPCIRKADDLCNEELDAHTGGEMRPGSTHAR
jgi:ribonuclease HI